MPFDPRDRRQAGYPQLGVIKGMIDERRKFFPLRQFSLDCPLVETSRAYLVKYLVKYCEIANFLRKALNFSYANFVRKLCLSSTNQTIYIYNNKYTRNSFRKRKTLEFLIITFLLKLYYFLSSVPKSLIPYSSLSSFALMKQQGFQIYPISMFFDESEKKDNFLFYLRLHRQLNRSSVI